MIDSVNDGIKGTASKEMEEECGIKLRPSDLIDLTELACQEAIEAGHLPCAGIPPSPGGSDEFIQYTYVERIVSKADLYRMRGRLAGLREHGEYITLRVVPMEDMWKISGDSKAIWYVTFCCTMYSSASWFLSRWGLLCIPVLYFLQIS
jgi:ADP-sugar diphosphatase